MKTFHTIKLAWQKLQERIQTPGLTDVQKALVCGMMNALVWVADCPNADTMERMLSDEPLAAGKDPSLALDRLKAMEAKPANAPGTNTGHGHVWERPDGAKARCGGPAMCTECRDDELSLKAESFFICPRCGQTMAHSRLRGMFCMTCR